MTFLAMSSQRSLCLLQKSQLQFEQTLIMNQVSWIQNQMTERSDELGTEGDLDNDPIYVNLQQQDEYLTTRQTALEEQIAAVDATINSLKSTINTNIKSSCSLNLIGG